MAILQTINPTLLDLANKMDPDGKIPTVVEILNETNEILEDMTWLEGNLPTGHRTKIRTGLPTPTWRALYQGVQPGRSTMASVTDTCGMMEAYSEIDVIEANLNGNTSEFRLSEDRAYFEGFNQTLADALFYANERTQPARFTGFAPRFNTRVLANAESAENVIDGGGTGSDNLSIWLVVWGPNTCHGIIPKGIPAGLQMEDKGQQTVQVFNAAGANTGKMEAYVTNYRWHAGLCVKDWRYVVRICNIDRSDLTATGATGANLIDLMTQALELPPSLKMGRPVFYMPKFVRGFLRRQIVNRVINSSLTMEQVAGKRVMVMDDVPVRICASLGVDEARVI